MNGKDCSLTFSFSPAIKKTRSFCCLWHAVKAALGFPDCTGMETRVRECRLLKIRPLILCSLIPSGLIKGHNKIFSNVNDNNPHYKGCLSSLDFYIPWCVHHMPVTLKCAFMRLSSANCVHMSDLHFPRSQSSSTLTPEVRKTHLWGPQANYQPRWKFATDKALSKPKSALKEWQLRVIFTPISRKDNVPYWQRSSRQRWHKAKCWKYPW